MNHKVAFSFADGKTLFFPVNANEILLDAALRNGIKIPLDCREGVCGTCQGRCESGNYSQDYVDEEALSSADLEQRKMLSCQTRVQSDATFYFDFDSSLCSAAGPALLGATVSAVRQVSDSTAILQLQLDEGQAALDFLPGQYARLSVPGTSSKRSYSFANRSGSQQLQFLLRLLPDGAMSNYIRERCQVGDRIELEAPLGAFYLRHIVRPLVLVAGGTGLSALLAMLEQLVADGCTQPVHLYYGVRNVADLCETARIEAYAGQLPGFRYTPVISEPTADWPGKRGYIAEHFDCSELRDAPVDMYVCGPPPMVESIKNWLQDQQLESVQLYYEKFTESNI
ncbi:anthranilate 1,2-dioxygenase electron transfer component AntC [Pseudomonas chlororaphis]|uniref:anthranilate 1,2-dioxygenase electron transfer component AntC n=1 Tax=Pseudomonas chlororaphis TaxID=587753 RepID=UPI0006A5CB3B|nr:anthranilate 1,2-dioxygenase electron transfer component AntC [Pseudomonas chlororaphis]AZC99985.1 benzoate dioxygenase, ferredoxin reductase component [Pseudomonas chlororaphis subsp. chlororaphis]MBM0282031.1 anthranilate 1,2-dioxygenase electron transfer component AntC [Pseudomonas chlororaphis]MDO1504424.1 anthranilate 1,2-dioxygenase electron transfer component AntC [Pseudomonas chlororaphis]ORM49466.1 anthranilate dioxygenase reductase [Pseudomonas chlororaphis subsp. chlororaphis]TWR